MAELDATKCTALTRVECNTSQMATLNVSGCTKLKRLGCWENQLTTLDISKCSQLTDLECNANQLTTLDVTACTQLTNLACQKNQLKKLDLSKNKALVECICQNNLLTELTLCKSGAITNLYVTNNQLAGEAMDKFIESMPVQEQAFFTVLDAVDPDLEQNVCTTTQVAAANAKGWTAYQWINGAWEVYGGSDPTPIISTLADNDGDESAPAYNLSGRRITTPQKGIIIRNGRKYLYK